MAKKINYLILTSLFIFSQNCTAASFDCAKAVGYAETAICKNSELSRLDEELSRKYKASILESASSEQLKQEQKEWIKRTRNCKDEDCLLSEYKTRISSLSQSANSVDKPSGKIPKNNTLREEPTQRIVGTEDGKSLVENISEGVGADVASASQNAAFNALTNVVGTFIDANKVLEKRSQIEDGIRKQTSSIKTDIKEYSQGSIKSITILSTTNNNGLIRVKAKVVVRLDDFKAYVKKIASGETQINDGFFAEVSTAKKQKTNHADLLYSNVIEPLSSGKVYSFILGKPVALNNLSQEKLKELGLNGEIGRAEIDKILVPVEVVIDGGFFQNMTKTLESISDDKKSVKNPNPINSDFGNYSTSNKVVYIETTPSGNDPRNSFYDAYLNKDVLGLFEKNGWITSAKGGWKILGIFNKKLQITISNASGEVIYKDLIDSNDRNSWNKFRDLSKGFSKSIAPWIPIEYTEFYYDSVIRKSKRFAILLDLPPNVLREAKSVALNLTN